MESMRVQKHAFARKYNPGQFTAIKQKIPQTERNCGHRHKK